MARNRDVENALRQLKKKIKKEKPKKLTFNEYLELIRSDPAFVLRNQNQIFSDMLTHYLGKGTDEYPSDPESINYRQYDATNLFVKGLHRPYFADRLFINRLVRKAHTLRNDGQQNKVTLYQGPPGCGKSTFLNALLHRFEEFANSPKGLRYELVWDLNIRKIKEAQGEKQSNPEGVLNLACDPNSSQPTSLEVCCPSHDSPILLVPESDRKPFLSDLLAGSDDAKTALKILQDKEYEWIFRQKLCPICHAMLETLFDIFHASKDPLTEILQMVKVKPYKFNRRLGSGIVVYNPDDVEPHDTVITDKVIQENMDKLFGGKKVLYNYSKFAPTNRGIYALMDLKPPHNTTRFNNLHNILSEETHRVGKLEEKVYGHFVAVMNPGDDQPRHNNEISADDSFQDRKETLNINYTLTPETEVEIYRSVFGADIDNLFMPGVLHNFAKIIISTRLDGISPAIKEWIDDPDEYEKYCDQDMKLLEMSIYSGHIPTWLSEEHRDKFKAKRRKQVIMHSENRGRDGISGRLSIKLFGEFYNKFRTIAEQKKSDERARFELITMENIIKFFMTASGPYAATGESGEKKSLEFDNNFIQSLQHQYHYRIVHQIQESLFRYNEKQIETDILNYLHAINCELGDKEESPYTGEKFIVSNEMFDSIEYNLFGLDRSPEARLRRREQEQSSYVIKTLREISVNGLKITETEQFKDLFDRYRRNIRQNVLTPLIESDSYEQAFKDYKTDRFETHDNRVKRDIKRMLKRMQELYHYDENGALEIILYAIRKDLPKKFKEKMSE